MNLLKKLWKRFVKFANGRGTNSTGPRCGNEDRRFRI